MMGNKQQIQEYLEKQKEDDSIYEITKKRDKTIRSLAQNRYYFGIIVPTISQFHGYTTIETHELIKGMFKLETTTGLAIDEFKSMCEMIIDLWQTKFDCHIPLPKDINDDKSLMDSLGF